MQPVLSPRADFVRAMLRACQRVRRAVEGGKLPNLKEVITTCVDCKNKRALFYEHRDYSKPLEVEPVCGGCNRRRGSARWDGTMAVDKGKGVLVCALSEFGECKETFLYSHSKPQRICCTPAHNSRLRWLRRKSRINKALEIAEREVRDNGV